MFLFVVVWPWWTLSKDPVQGAVAGLVGLVGWLRFGPPMMPGLLPGLMGMVALGSNLVVMGLGIWRGGSG